MVDQYAVVDEVADDDAAASQVPEPGQRAEPADEVAEPFADFERRALSYPLVLSSGCWVPSGSVSRWREEILGSDTYEELNSARDK